MRVGAGYGAGVRGVRAGTLRQLVACHLRLVYVACTRRERDCVCWRCVLFRLAYAVPQACSTCGQNLYPPLLPAPCAPSLQGIQEQRGDPVTASNAVQELLERARELCREQEAKKDELKANYTESSNLARENWTGELLFPVSPGGGCCCSCHHPLRRGVTDLVGTSPF